MGGKNQSTTEIVTMEDITSRLRVKVSWVCAHANIGDYKLASGIEGVEQRRPP